MDYDRFVSLSESSAASGRFHVAVIPLLVAADDWSAASLVGAQRCKVGGFVDITSHNLVS